MFIPMNSLDMAKGLTGSYLPNLPKCNNHMRSYFQDHVKEGKVRDLDGNAHEHFELSTKESAKAQALRATSIPTLPLWGTHVGGRQPPARVDHGLDPISQCLHNSKQHLP